MLGLLVYYWWQYFQLLSQYYLIFEPGLHFHWPNCSLLELSFDFLGVCFNCHLYYYYSQSKCYFCLWSYCFDPIPDYFLDIDWGQRLYYLSYSSWLFTIRLVESQWEERICIWITLHQLKNELFRPTIYWRNLI